MNNSNFFIRENKIYNIDSTELLPDENGVIKVILYGYERRFKYDRFINFLEMNNYTKFFKSPLKQKKIKKEKVVKLKKEKPIKIPKIKKEYQKVIFDKRKTKGRKIICSNGKVYNSIAEAEIELNLTRTQIWSVCTGRWKHTKNLIFKYL
jgi:hypothetical protein